jgi:hypothetical protein
VPLLLRVDPAEQPATLVCVHAARLPADLPQGTLVPADLADQAASRPRSQPSSASSRTDVTAVASDP